MKPVTIFLGLKLLGFIDKDEIYFKHHTKHSYFIYPNEKIIIGSNRVFTALLNSMIKKNKIGIGILSCKKRDVPYLVSISPQVHLEDMINNSNSQKRPAGMNLCILPWADEIRELNINEPQLDCITNKAFENESEQGKKIIEITEKIIKKLRIIYSPNNIKNPALQFHYDFLSSKYLSENFEETEDTSLPWYSLIQQKCGNLISELKKEIENDSRVESSLHTMLSLSSLLSKKRRRIEDGEGVDLGLVESKFKANKQSTLVVQQLKDYLIFKNVLKKPGISGGMSKNLLKADLIELVRTNLIKEGKL
ncbi:SPOC like C-terminal domain-containing protein [Phakopsora pachyrhizi]|uniref:DNA helicase n=1 Tax=Phakopsora pachyrhizi TaxID=170000 RepID=A0AAV0AQ59_PHAPC|nr:SPOC like C-terminal domain-containing protein [Phakopsora pachyrhizi]CAH7670582.1 SPOC like C-terminal domain-containing protein [Phakopsora pachyrhizi]